MVSPTNGWNQIKKKGLEKTKFGNTTWKTKLNLETPLGKQWEFSGKNRKAKKMIFGKKKTEKPKKWFSEKKNRKAKKWFSKKNRKAKKWFSKKKHRKAKKWFSKNENDSVKIQQQQWTSSENNIFDLFGLLTLLSSLYYQLHLKPDLHERRIGESGIASAYLETSGRGIRWRRSRKPGPTTTRTVLQSNLALPV